MMKNEKRGDGGERDLPAARVKKNGAPEGQGTETRMGAERAGVKCRDPAAGPRNAIGFQKPVRFVPKTKKRQSQA